MTKKLKNILGYSLFLLLGILLVRMVFYDANFSKILIYLKKADFTWILITVLVSFVCHVIRALRWKLFIDAHHSTTKSVYVYHSMMFGYFVNFFVPRLGEIMRCVAIRKQNKISFNVSLGTVLLDKLFDSIVLMVITLSTLFIRLGDFKELWKMMKPSSESSNNFVLYFMAGLIIVLFLTFVFLNSKAKMKVKQFFRQVLKGFLSLNKVKQKPLIIVYTLLVWIAYFFMTYLCVQALNLQNNISVSDTMVLIAIGGIARIIPIPGGSFGAYHYMIAVTVVYLAGVSFELGIALAFVIHGIQACFYIVIGGLSSLVVLKTKFLRN